jgi:hypothetical protein
MSRNYNYIYSQLVEDKADIIGHIAYALYKEEKIEYITKFKQDHGIEPNEDDLKPFNTISSTQSSLDRYKLVASCIMKEFLSNTLEESMKDMEEWMNQNHLTQIGKVIDPIKPPSDSIWKRYMHGILQSILGSFLFMILLCGLIFILKFSDTQYTFTFGGKGDARIEQVDIKTPISELPSTSEETSNL